MFERLKKLLPPHHLSYPVHLDKGDHIRFMHGEFIAAEDMTLASDADAMLVLMSGIPTRFTKRGRIHIGLARFKAPAPVQPHPTPPPTPQVPLS